ncbi:DUF885 domain-containing protein [Thalassomonas sp. M1454]|uniref:DUF885 domain-containing protein n=1 Tax=Thalassomonas sp. M1454 TaxID=2594477 RepID=UPI0011804D34|nr:DUF885 domain-containing protein [Thalassomonas sp. M1454]TRX57264.1 DUF885 domain-containing protein [Thalassomonas sp. M1454]
MKTYLPSLLVVGLLSACSSENNATADSVATAQVNNQQSNSQQSESERLNQWFAQQYEKQLQLSPMYLTFLGRKEQYDKIDDVSAEEEQRQFEIAGQVVAELKANFDYEKLTDEAKISYDIWVYQYEQSVAGQPFKDNGYIFTQMQGIQSFMAQFLINFHKVDTESDMIAYNKRIGGISDAIATLLTRTQLQSKKGIRAPRFAYEGVIEQASNLITGKPFTEAEQDSALWSDAKRKVAALVAAGTIDQSKADLLLAESKQALLNSFYPTYQALIAWFESDISNTDEIAKGVGAQPNGTDYYNYRLRASTTTDLTAEQIHQIGLDEVARLTSEMEAIKSKVGFKGTLKEFFKFIKDDDQFYYPNTDEGRQGYITDTDAYLAFINEQLPKYFGILPKADLVVKRVEAFREQDGAAQHYHPGTPDGSRPGVYYAHLSDMRSMPKNEMEAIAYHEGNPGHHMQVSIAQELTSVPQFRTQANFTAYSEGWGLYSELLAKEMGAYTSDYSDFGRLITEIWRAVRLVVDTGLHSKGWTEEQAIAYFKEKTPIAEEAVVSEVRRYLVMPGQATAYKIGMLKILELRSNAQNELGDKFDIRGFHDTILGGGAMPLAILERRVNTWIASQK